MMSSFKNRDRTTHTHTHRCGSVLFVCVVFAYTEGVLACGGDDIHAHTYTVTRTCQFFPNVVLMNHSGFKKATEDTLILFRQGFNS